MSILRALYELGEGTEQEILDHAEITTRTGTMFSDLRNKDGWIRIGSGVLKSKTNPVRYVLSDKAKTDLAPFLDPEPEPESGVVIELPHRPEPEPTPTPVPTPHKPRAKSLDVTMAAVDKILTRDGVTHAQAISWLQDHSTS